MEVQRGSISKSPRSRVLFWMVVEAGMVTDESWVLRGDGRDRSRYNRLLAGLRPSALVEGYATSQ